jgi:hypothetical protein
MSRRPPSLRRPSRARRARRGAGRLGVEGALTAQQVADELDVTLGTLAVTERELARVLNFARYARRLPVGWA